MLLLVHGRPTSSIGWSGMDDPLSTGFGVCALDFPGYGFSDKPQGWGYSLTRDAELTGFCLSQVLGAEASVIVAHDRGGSVALVYAARCAEGRAATRLEHLVLTNGNIFLPLSNLTQAQRHMLGARPWSQIAAAVTPGALAAGLAAATRTPPREPGDPQVEALTAALARGNGTRVLHETIQYLAERAQDEHRWLAAPDQRPVPRHHDLGPVRHGLTAAGRELRAEPVPDAQARRQPPVLHPGRKSLPAPAFDIIRAV